MSDIRDMVAETASRLFRDAWAQGLTAFERSHWDQAVEIGLPGLLAAKDGGWRNAEVVMHAMGRYASALPLAETMLAAHTLTRCSEPIPQAPLAIAPRCRGQLHWRDGGWQFSGELPGLALVADTETVVAILEHAEHPSLLRLAPEAAASRRDGVNLAGEPRVRLRFEDAPVTIAAMTGLDAQAVFEKAALLRVGQSVGALTAALEMAAEYAGNRKQFGRSIAEFQSVQQALALFGEEVAAAGAATSAAFAAADNGDAGFEIACAKLRVNEAIGQGAAIAHQVHGAIGFTRDYGLWRFTQRLLSWRSEYGNDHYWASRLGSRVAARGPANFWADLTARGDAVAVAAEREH